MANLKLSDVSPGATLLKKLVAKADTNLDGAIRTGEVRSIAPANPRVAAPKRQRDLASAIDGARRYSVSKGSAKVVDLKKAVDVFAKSLKAGDKDGDKLLSDAEQKSLPTVGAKRFAAFVQGQGRAKVTDFKLAEQKVRAPSRFSWSGTTAQVTSSLLNAFSDPKKNNYWPSWSQLSGAARYVLTKAEATKMVKGLDPLFPARQKAVITELASRTLNSEYGCVTVDAGARAVLEAFAKKVGATGLKFKSPAAPKLVI